MLQAIKSDDDYSEAVDRIWDLFIVETPVGSIEYEELQHLLKLVESYDDQHYPPRSI